MSEAPKLSQVIRLDSLPLNQTYFTPEGYLMDRPILTSTGIFEYTNPDGSVRRELRLPEEVFAAESLASYQGKPIIITHDAGLVDKDNVQKHQIGTILTEGYRSGDDVRAEIVIHNTDEMRYCGLKELSLGYNLTLDETPGEWNGQHYDAIQRDIRINHLALVREARAGEQARLNIDGRDPARTLKGGKVMKKKNAPKNARRADGVLSPEELAKAIEEYKARRAQRLAAKTDEDPTEGTDPVASAKPTNAPAAAQDDDDTVVAPAGQEPQTVEDKVAAVKDNRDRRDADGDPEDLESAKGVIANQDEDIDILFDIIDTLLAQKEFDEAGCTDPQTDEGDDTTDENNDEGDDDTDNQDSDDDPIPTATPADHTQGEVLNADGIDAIIRQRVKIGMIGKALNLDGVEDMSISAAKKAIIKAVRPEMRLDGKSDAFVNAAFEYAVADVESRSKKDVGYQKKQMFNRDSRTPVSNGVGSADSARQKMIERRQNRAKEEK
jgi:hypothetical protein